MTLRARFLAKLPLGVGLTGKAGPQREAYALHLGGPDEDHDVAISMASYRDGKRFSSTCGLEMRCCLAAAGYVDPKRISGKYRPRMGLVMSDLEAIAVEHGAKVDPSIGTLPKSGDIAALAWTDPSHAHVFGIESVELVDERTLRLVAVEGGQIDREQPPNQVTARKIHTWKWHPERGALGQWLDTSIAIEPVGVVVDGVTARPVSWWIDIDKLDASTAKTDPAPPPTCGKRCDHGSGCLRPVHADGRHETRHGCVFFDPSPTSSASALPSVTLRRGSTGDAVRRWQAVVGATPADGIFGPGTEALTKVWQTRHGLTPDGVVGARTWATAIGAGTAPSVGSSTRPEGTGAPRPADPTGTLPQVPGLLEREAKEPGFCRAFLAVLNAAEADNDRVTALLAEESRFNPAAHNPAGGASGLMQWMPFLWEPWRKTGFAAIAPSPEALRAMTATQQLPLVALTLKLWGPRGVKDPALAGWGSNVGSPDDTILATKDEPGRIAFYRDNAGYDRNKDGHITAGEVRAAVYGLLLGASKLPRVGLDGRLRSL